jgi:predicted nucleic acid-binding protein
VERGLRSGSVFDALHVVCAERAGADLIVTNDVEDFERLVVAGGLRGVACDTPPETIARRFQR